MARRKRIEAPSDEALAKLDAEGFAAKPSALAPIAQVAGEAAALASPLPPAEQAARAKERTDAEALRRARAQGWEVRDIPIPEIRADAMTRDRMSLEPDAMEELRASIRANGLRMPIEVSLRNPNDDGEGYDLISGLRRLTAMRDVAGEGGTVRAFVRPQKSDAANLEAMVEENEVRVNLTSYERGRAASMAVQDGVFPDVETAVNALFSTASKAKRSKVRSFARVHEELGDLLTFPQMLSERQCLKIAAGLKAGLGGALRQALGTGQGTEPETEWALLEQVLAKAPSPSERRASTPKPLTPTWNPGWVPLANGLMIRHDVDHKGHAIRFEGKQVDREFIETVMDEIVRLLE
ncbi:MAG: ParB N-terminal domain-containing protein [Pseudomonadota bacterium]